MKYRLYKTYNGGYMLGRKRFMRREAFWSGSNWWVRAGSVLDFCIHDKEDTIYNIKLLTLRNQTIPSKVEVSASNDLNYVLNYLEKDLV